MIRGIIEQTGVKIDVEDTGRVNVASSDADGLAKALEIIGNLTAVPEIGKTYLGKVVRLAEFGAFIELFPGTDGLLHISEIAEHRVKEVKDELNEGDQVLVRVLGIEGNRIKLSRKALLKEQRQKLGLPEPGVAGRYPGQRRARAAGTVLRSSVSRSSNASTITIEGGDDFDEVEGGDDFEDGDEPNFNRVDGPVPATVGAPAGGGVGTGAGPGGQRRRRRRSGGGGGGRGRGPGGPGPGNRGPR